MQLFEPMCESLHCRDEEWLVFRKGIKKSYSVPSQDYTADDSSNQCFECGKMQLFEPVCESLHCRGEE